MTTTINASTTSGLVQTADNSGILALQTAGTTAVTINASQNVGLGTSSPAVKLDINGITGWSGGTTGIVGSIVGTNASIGNGGNLRVLSNTTQAVDVGGSISLGGYVTSTSSSVDFVEIAGRKENSTAGNTAGYLAFGTRPNAGNTTERMRIDSVGNVFLNTTTALSAPAKITIVYPGDSTWGLGLKSTYAGGGQPLTFVNSTGSNIGYIGVTATTVSYVSTSDYRLKKEITSITGALSKVQALKPVTYKWKLDGSDGEGFIAHELAEVCPYAVSGKKDAVDEEGNPVYQGIDTSFLVATLTAAIQEQQALIVQLQADVAALKGVSA